MIQRSGSVLVDPDLIAQLCSLLNAPETPPGEDARMCREPLPRRARNPETPPGEEARMRREPLPRKARDEPGREGGRSETASLGVLRFVRMIEGDIARLCENKKCRPQGRRYIDQTKGPGTCNGMRTHPRGRKIV